MRIHEDVRDLLVQEERGDRTEVERVVEQLLDETLLVGAREPKLRLAQEAARQRIHLVPALAVVEPLQGAQVELADELAMKPSLELLVFVRHPRLGRRQELGFADGRGRRRAAEAIAEVHRATFLPKRPRRVTGSGFTGASRSRSMAASVERSRAAGVSGESRHTGRPALTAAKTRA